MTSTVKSEDAIPYKVISPVANKKSINSKGQAKNRPDPFGFFGEDSIIEQAMTILARRVAFAGDAMSNPVDVKNYLILELAKELDEVFCVMFLNNRHRVISFERLLQGAIDGASVYPRVVVRKALERNAAAVILVHNHPSGVAEPSRADIALTKRLKDALSLVDVRVLDHLIVAGTMATSLAEQGLL